MSLATIDTIMGRIKSSSEESQIAVFKSNEPGLLNAVFDDTFLTQECIKNGYTTYIGSYHKGMPKNQVAEELRKHISWGD